MKQKSILCLDTIVPAWAVCAIEYGEEGTYDFTKEDREQYDDFMDFINEHPFDSAEYEDQEEGLYTPHHTFGGCTFGKSVRMKAYLLLAGKELSLIERMWKILRDCRRNDGACRSVKELLKAGRPINADFQNYDVSRIIKYMREGKEVIWRADSSSSWLFTTDEGEYRKQMETYKDKVAMWSKDGWDVKCLFEDCLYSKRYMKTYYVRNYRLYEVTPEEVVARMDKMVRSIADEILYPNRHAA